MFLSACVTSASSAASFSRAARAASALPRRACSICAFSRGSCARSAPSRSICSSRSAGGGSVACKAEIFFRRSRSAASLSWRRRSTVASSLSQRSAADFASLRRSTRGRFSSSSFAIVAACSLEFSWRCVSICLSASSIFAIRTATSFCSCSSFFRATISFRTSGNLAASAVPSRPSAISDFCRWRFSCLSARRVRWRRTFSVSSRNPVEMKLTR